MSDGRKSIFRDLDIFAPIRVLFVFCTALLKHSRAENQCIKMVFHVKHAESIENEREKKVKGRHTLMICIDLLFYGFGSIMKKKKNNRISSYTNMELRESGKGREKKIDRFFVMFVVHRTMLAVYIENVRNSNICYMALTEFAAAFDRRQEQIEIHSAQNVNDTYNSFSVLFLFRSRSLPLCHL